VKIEQAWTEEQLISSIVSGEFRFPPTELKYFQVPQSLGLDGGLEVGWFDQSARFAFEYKSLSTPKVIEEAAQWAISRAKARQLLPMVIAPYLSEQILDGLQERLVSGLDLCGNGVVVAPGQFWLRQGRNPNRFRDSRPIRNVFRGTSSLVPRCFLLQESFETQDKLRAFALAQMPDSAHTEEGATILTKGTVSKVVQILEQERIVTRALGRIRLVSRESLLEQLQVNYRKGEGRTVLGKCALQPDGIWSRLAESRVLYAATGLSSASRYGLISGLDRQQIYVENLTRAIDLLMVKPTRLFPNVELVEDSSPVPYFDTRSEGPERWASPVQTWLELSLGEPRERVAALQLRSKLALSEAR